MLKGTKQIALGILLLLIFTSACATTGGSMGAGAGSGALLGAGIGALADPGNSGENRVRNILIGSAAGGIVGAGTGYIIHQNVKEEKEESYQKGKSDAQKEASDRAASSQGNPPKLVPPKTEARWVPDQVRGSVFVPGHFEYLILEGAHWETER